MRFANQLRFGAPLALLALAGCGGDGSDTPAPKTTTTLQSTAAAAGPNIGSVPAARLLNQGTFGPTGSGVDAVAGQSYDTWFQTQASAPQSLILPQLKDPTDFWPPYWWRNVVLGPDQLRQRMAFALSEIFVETGTGDNATQAAYYDVLTRNALGNYRQLLEQVTLQPAMGLFLNMLRSDKPNPATGVHADQNYAREVMQLFTVGLFKLNPDGTVQHDASGNGIPSYGQGEVEGMANVLTGWSSHSDAGGEQGWLYGNDLIHPMDPYDAHHDGSGNTIIGGVSVPAGGSARGDLKIALDTLFNHPNTAPFISRQLIQRLVTSNPSPAYVARVAGVFANNGSGVRGDLLAVARAILTDPEAVNSGGAGYGKLREPLLRLTALWRAFEATDSNGAINEYQVVVNARNNLGQAPLQAPSVFNFFVPDYVRAGPLGDAGLVAPEFQITNENSVALVSNMFLRQGYQFIDSGGTRYFGPYGYSELQNTGPDSVFLHTAAWESLANNPGALIDRLNLVLMAGQMPAAMRSALIAYVNRIPTSEASYRGARAAEAAELIVTSPQFTVQR